MDFDRLIILAALCPTYPLSCLSPEFRVPFFYAPRAPTSLKSAGRNFRDGGCPFQPLIFRNFGVILHLFDSIPGRKISLLYFDIFLIDRQNVVDTPVEKSPVVRDEDKALFFFR